MLEVDVLHTRSVLPVEQNRSISTSMSWGPVLLSIRPIELTFLLLLNTYLDLCIFVCIIIFIFIDHIPSLLFFSPNLFMHRIHSKPEIITDLSLFFFTITYSHDPNNVLHYIYTNVLENRPAALA